MNCVYSYFTNNWITNLRIDGHLVVFCYSTNSFVMIAISSRTCSCCSAFAVFGYDSGDDRFI